MAGRDLRVIADATRSAAGLAATACEAAGALRLGSVATTISGALSGMISAGAASELSGVWDTAISTWSTDVRDHEATNTHLRLLTRRAYDYRSPEALITMADLTRGGLSPPLPGRS